MESFNWIKAVDLSPLLWFKAIKTGLLLSGIVFIGVTIYRAYFLRTVLQKQTTTFRGQVGQVIVQAPKAGNGRLRPFIALYGETRLQDPQDLSVGVQIGAQF